MNSAATLRHVHKNFDRKPIGWRSCRHTTVRVLFLHMLCLQDKQSTQTTIADFYSTICVRLCGAMFHIYWETLSLFCWQRLLSVANDVINLLRRWCGEVFEHSPYLPGISRCGLDLFPKLKEHLQIIRFPDLASVLRPVGRSVTVINKRNIANGIQRFPDIW